MHDAEKQTDTTPETGPDLPLSRNARLAVFGGSFDPVHNGHLYIAGEVLRRGLAEEVIFVPSGHPPHKAPEALASAEHRLAMLSLATKPFDAFSVSDIEITRQEGPAYTINTLELLSAAYPASDLAFLMGADSLAELHTWYRSFELASKYEIIIYPRGAAQAPNRAALSGHFGPRIARKLLDSVLDGAEMPISASLVRALAAEQQSLAGLLPDSLQRYMTDHALYQTALPDVSPTTPQG